MAEPQLQVDLSGALPESGKRVEALVNKALESGFADDVPMQEVLDDFLLAAAVIMILVHKTLPGADLCPPMSGRPLMDAARHAVSELAASMAGRMKDGGADA